MNKSFIKLLTTTALITLSLLTTLEGKNYTVTKKNGINYISNKNIAQTDDFNTSLKEVLTISPLDFDGNSKSSEGVISPESYQVDSEGNIFIFDESENNTVKFNNKGNFIKKFGRIGSGPGEYKQSSKCDMVRNKIVICDQLSRKLVFFDNSGKFVKNITPNRNLPTELVAVGKENFLGIDNYQKQKDGTFILGFALTLLDKDFKEIKKIWYEECEMGPDLSVKIAAIVGRFPSFAVTESKIFVANKKIDEYKIYSYNLDGILEKVIVKRYRNISKTKKELSDASSEVITEIKGETGEKKIYTKEGDRYKFSIGKILVDKNNILWVETAKDAKKFDCSKYTFFDQYNSDGILLRTVKLNKDYREIKFINNNMYAFINEDNVLKSFDY